MKAILAHPLRNRALTGMPVLVMQRQPPMGPEWASVIPLETRNGWVQGMSQFVLRSELEYPDQRAIFFSDQSPIIGH